MTSENRQLRDDDLAQYHGFLAFKPQQMEQLLGEGCPKIQPNNWKPPRVTAESKQKARPGYDSCDANEYRDEDDTLSEKIKLLASIIKKSQRFVVYSGAGISTASGIGDYASRAENSVGVMGERGIQKPWSEFDAKPTIAHCIISELHKHGYVKHWIQQNHDGLPQKAGYPQHKINEIHGSWYDPSNPVVQMSGNLRSDLFEDLLLCTEEADFCLVVGTSLAGMNSDRVALMVANRAIAEVDGNFGNCIISVQKTTSDSKSSLRLFCTIDEAMSLLANELNIPIPSIPTSDLLLSSIDPQFIKEEDVFILSHYDENGLLKPESDDSSKMLLDLREDAEIMIPVGPYAGCKGEVTGKHKEGHFRVRVMHRLNNNFMAPKVHTLGIWWIIAAINGTVPSIPIVNTGNSLKYL